MSVKCWSRSEVEVIQKIDKYGSASRQEGSGCLHSVRCFKTISNVEDIVMSQDLT